MTKEIKVEKGIPVSGIKGRGAKEKYPFSKLKIGESFVMKKVGINYSGNLVHAASKRLNVKFIARTTPEGVRIWRISK